MPQIIDKYKFLIHITIFSFAHQRQFLFRLSYRESSHYISLVKVIFINALPIIFFRSKSFLSVSIFFKSVYLPLYKAASQERR